MAVLRRLHGHPVRDRRGHREDHDRPARGPQRVPPAHREGADQGVRRGSRRPDHRRRRADRRGARRVLQRRRPEDPGRRRLRGRSGHRAPERARSADPDPAHAEARRRDGGRLRDRRRPCPARLLRPHDRGRQRAVRPDGTPGRVVRRRIRDQPACAADRREAREGDLVPLPAVRRPHGARVGPGERGRAARGAGGDDGRVVPRDARALAARAATAEGGRERGRPTAWPGCNSSPATPRSSTT